MEKAIIKKCKECYTNFESFFKNDLFCSDKCKTLYFDSINEYDIPDDLGYIEENE